MHSKSGAARRIANKRFSDKTIMSKTQSDSNLVANKNFSIEDDDDFVDISELPPVPQKVAAKMPPKLFPKQKINR